ncbi:MAG TPA: carboxylating nicotinate-nucleotide diphosphorylase [Chitinophagaceae bacterium]|nr:carboxylating nicotinate-nucleotide diphosphorylase [Chitinophagaceae bacterium]MCC6634680.1 carboxylating nicotinate-nucleotide diphosphorylase [Chitinophagaceae bacterium]HNL81822.1 carboxylating nicotinate-nucleotide diphosphorylase [Chitinophagaceae bacterium]HNM35253.1 carboxylating nicotinate-nucleotide diphosphorylase [Chitinophagaceae bacterium]HNN31507.1 carboxylating nicotinate-nucleotide diphosphorylase [Chitinophagaceae bacterium]
MQNFNEQLKHLVTQALQEDVGDGDHSTLSCIPANKKGKAVLKIKQDGVLAGVSVAEKIFKQIEPSANFIYFKQDGESMLSGDKAFEVEASIHTILTCERLVLNCMQRMSGIATLTKTYTEKLQGFHTQLLDTRKTTPNFRLLEKEAVRIGGGINHRFGLYDMIMLKDNHIDYAGGLENAIDKAWLYATNYKPLLKIEVETRSMEDVVKVCEVGMGKVFRIMLDNFTPEQVLKAVQIINNRFQTEASGGINLKTIQAYAATGVDYVSVGGLIHQATSVDLSLKAVITN